MAKFGIGIVGAGMALPPHFLALKDLDAQISVRGLFTRTAATRDAAAKEHGIAAVESLQELLDDPKCDALLVLTPPNQRLEIVERAAAAGKHILLEKPVERTAGAARQIIRICEKAGVTLGVIFQHRFRKSSLALRRLLDEGALGDLASATLVVPWWRPQSYYDQPGRGTLERDGGGVLLTQAIHAMDLMLSMTGPVAEVQAIAGTTTMHRMETEDFVSAGMRFANGALGGLTATVNCFPGDQEYLMLNCSNATARLAGGALDIHWLDGRHDHFGEPVKTGGGVNPMDFPHDWHRAQIADFVLAVQADKAPASTGRTALLVHELIDALMLSSQLGQRVTVGAV